MKSAGAPTHPGARQLLITAEYADATDQCVARQCAVDNPLHGQAAELQAVEHDTPMSAAALESELRAAFPDAEIVIDDLAGDGDHYRARITSTQCAGLPRVRQHQLVYAALKGKVGGELHALALETATPPKEAEG